MPLNLSRRLSPVSFVRIVCYSALALLLSAVSPQVIQAQSVTNALDFDGTNDRVTIPDNNALDFTNNYTLEAWIYPTQFVHLAGIIGKYHTDLANGYFLRLEGTSGRLSFDERTTTANVLTLNAWNHIAAVNDNGTRRLYVDGIEVTLNSASFTVQANSDPLRLGQDYARDNSRYFKGKIDEVRLWSVVRSAAQINASVYEMMQGTETGLVAYYRFDQHTAGGSNAGQTTLTNLTSVSGLNGTLENFGLSGAASNWVSGYNEFLPLVSTTVPSAVTASAATGGGNVSHDGGVAVTARGVVWSTSASPTVALSTKTTDGTGTGIFTSNLTGLSALTTYYVRAYATTLAGTSYGTEQTFTTLNAALAFSYASPTQTLVNGAAIATPIALTVTGGVPDKAQVSRLAGSGSAMFINGKGTAAAFSSPFGVWADATENLYVSEAGNHRIRKIELATGQVTTLAGNGSGAFVDGSSTSASFKVPHGITGDGAGNLYIADRDNHAIRKIVISNGTVSTIAGNGSTGLADGTGAAARFNYPYGIAVNGSGELVVNDFSRGLIRKSTTSGVVSTFAGTGYAGAVNGIGTAASFNGPTGIGIDAAGNMYVAEYYNNLIRKITPGASVTTLTGSGAAGSADGSGASASFNAPMGLTVGPNGNIYVAEFAGRRIRSITSSGLVTTIAGTGTLGNADGSVTNASFGQPTGIAVDASGNIYVSDYYYHVIRIIAAYRISPALPAGLFFDARTGSISGTPTTAQAPKVYTVYAQNSFGTSTTTITIGIAAAPTVITTAATNVTATTATLSGTVNANGGATSALTIKYSTSQATVDAGNGTSATVTPSSASGNTVTAVSANITGLTAGTTYYYRVSATNPGGTTNGTSRSFTTAPPPPNISYASTAPVFSIGTPVTGQTIINTGGTILPMQVNTYVGAGLYGSSGGPRLTAKLAGPNGVLLDGLGNLYIADASTHRLRKLVLSTGIVSTVAGGSSFGYADGPGLSAMFNQPWSLAIDPNGKILITEASGCRIRKYDPSTGEVSTVAGSGSIGSTNGIGINASFYYPNGMALDGSGNLYVCDKFNHMIRKVVLATGQVSTFAGAGGGGSTDGPITSAKFSSPIGLAFDGNGDLLVTDLGNARIRKINMSTQVVSTIAGSTSGFADGTTGSALFHGPGGIFVDGSGNVYVSENQNVRIRMITPGGQVYTLAGDGVKEDLNGTATATGRFKFAGDLIVDPAGTIYVSDLSSNKVKTVSNFSVSPELPAGLTLNLATGEITGTPTALSAATNYTIMAANMGGRATTTISISVISSLMTTSVSTIGETSATTGGTVGSGFSGITERGVVWGTTTLPTTSGNKLADGSATIGSFTSNLTGLASNTTYYVRSYVLHSGGTAYGDEKNFKTNALGTFADITKTFGDAKFSLTAPTAVSTGAFSYGSSNAGVATISGSQVTIAGVGSTTITATQAASGAYTSASKNLTLTVNPATPTITLNIPNTTTLAAANNMAISATSSNGEPVTIAIGAGTATGALTGSPGSYLLNSVSATGNLVFNAATSATATHAAGSKTVTMNVEKNNQTITFNALTPVSFTTGMTQALTASSSSGEAVSFFVVSGPASVAGSTLTITGPGSILIRASQTGNGTFNPAPDVERTLTVNPSAPVITSFTPSSATEGDVVTITGQYFDNASAVSFGATAATSFTVVNSTTITAVVGTGHTGVVSVTTTGGTDTEAGFRYKVMWTGATNAFTSTGNWSGGRVPQTDDDIIFSATAASDLELDGNKTVGHVNFNGSGRSLKLGAHNLTIKGNLTMPGSISGTGRVIMNGTSAQTITGGGNIPDLEINNATGVAIDAAGDELTVSGTLISTAGTLTTNGKLRLTSNSGGTARVGVVTGTITGNVIAERYVKRNENSEGTGRAWRLVSVPVTGTGILRDFFMNGRNGQDLTLSTNRDAETDNSGTPIVGHNYTTAAEATTAGFDWIGVANSVSSLRSYVGDAGGGTFLSENVPSLSTTYAAAAQGYMVFTRGDRKLDFPNATSSGSTTFRSTGSLKTGTQTVSVAPASTSKFTLVGNPYMSVLDLDAFYTTNSAVINPSFWIWDANMAGTNNQGGYINVYKSGTQWVTNTGSYIDPQLIESGMAFFVEPVSSLSTATNINITEAHKSAASSAGLSPFATDQSDDHGRLYVRLERADAKGQRQLIDGVMADFHSSFKTTLGDLSDREKLRNGISRGALWLSTDQKILSSEGLPWPTETKRSIPLYMSGVGDQPLIVRIDPRGMRDRYVQAWLKDNVLKRQVELNMNAPTDYDFIGTGSAAWDSTRFEIVYVEAGRPSTGVTLEPDDAAELPSVKLYPNPSKSSDVKLSMRAMAPGAYSVHVLDMTGRLVATTSLQHRSVNGEYRILEGRLLSPGKYLIRLSQSGTPVQTLQLIHD